MGLETIVVEPWKILFSVLLVLMLGAILIYYVSHLSSIGQSGIDAISKLIRNSFQF